MTDKEIGVAKARKELGKIIKEVQYQGWAYIIKRHDEQAAAVVPIQLYQEWKKTRGFFRADQGDPG